VSTGGCLVAAAAAVLLLYVAPRPTDALAADRGTSQARLTAEEILEKNAQARGGREAWRKIQTIIWAGHLESERSAVPSLPFLLEVKRPNKSRFEITAPSQRSLRVFDGAHGWTMRAGEDGIPRLDPFTPQEEKFAHDAAGLEGPLIDVRDKGSTVDLEGLDELEGRRAYRLGVSTASGDRQQVWVDAETFREIRYDRTTYSARGSPGSVSIVYREYKPVQGLQLASVIEIGAGTGKTPDRMVIERVALNPSIDDAQFTRPPAAPHRPEVTVRPPTPQ
jgi:hypothetical protein